MNPEPETPNSPLGLVGTIFKDPKYLGTILAYILGALQNILGNLNVNYT